MKTQTRLLKALLIAPALLLVACEPPTPETSGETIREYTRSMNLSDWDTRLSTFNVWGLPVISKKKAERMPAIGKVLAAKNLDTVLLQENWLAKGQNLIFNNSNFPFRKDFSVKDTLGSGVSVLSQTNIERSSFRPFQLFGPVYLPDAWAIKGVGMSTAKREDLPVSYFTTHLMAGLPRYEEPRSPFTPEWKMEMFEVIAHVIEQTDSDAFVIAGDYNISRTAEEYEYWKELTSLEGTFLEEKQGLCTWCEENTWAKKWSRQIDYIFVSPRLTIENAWVDFKETIDVDGKPTSLSDHYGVTADLKAVQGSSEKSPAEVRRKFTSALNELEQELTSYHKKKKEEESANDLQAQGLDERVCTSCRIKTSLEMIHEYQAALQGPSQDANVERIRKRLESYFEIFR